MLNLILFGPPGSGKGTQAAILIEKYNLKHISTGDLLRSEVAAETELGLEAKKFMDKGDLVPDEVVIGMIGNKLDTEANKVNGFIFDGFPRTVAQAKALDSMLTEKGLSIDKVLSLHVGDEEIVKRLLQRAIDQGRPDDTKEVIQNRLNVYKSSTAVVADHYADQLKLADIQGEGSIEDIASRLAEQIDSISV